MPSIFWVCVIPIWLVVTIFLLDLLVEVWGSVRNRFRKPKRDLSESEEALDLFNGLRANGPLSLNSCSSHYRCTGRVECFTISPDSEIQLRKLPFALCTYHHEMVHLWVRSLTAYTLKLQKLTPDEAEVATVLHS